MVRHLHDATAARSIDRDFGPLEPAWEDWGSPHDAESSEDTAVPTTPTAPPPGRTDPAVIRNFCIIAHIDHGKSTLADRMLQLTGASTSAAPGRSTSTGWTSSASAASPSRARPSGCRGRCRPDNEQGAEPGTYVLNMIDTPGHVDFTYEVSRSLEACEAAVLLVDAAQGIEAQTLANLYLALAANLHIIPVLNKIDLPSAQPRSTPRSSPASSAATRATCCGPRAKTGLGVEALLNEIVKQTPPPVGDADAPPRALIFDSVYDTYRGVVTYVRVIDGRLSHRDRIKMMSTGAVHEMLEVGVISPEPVKAGDLGRRRGRLPDHRGEGRPPVPGRRHRHQPAPRRQPRRWAATSTRTRWSTPGSTRSTATTTRRCATPSSGSSSTTRRWPSSPRPPGRSASASAAASSGCSTWRSPATGSSASSTST